MKTCFKCNTEKPLSEFYEHKQMGDGHLNKCKECTKHDVAKHRNDNIEKVKEYDRLRATLPHRVKARKDYSKTENGIRAHKRGRKKYSLNNKEKIDIARKVYVMEHPEKVAESRKKYAMNNPEKRKAHNKVNNAMRDGRITRPTTCEVCGVDCKPHAHHWSYKEENWLDVQWVCIHCHVDIHHNN